MRISQIPNRMIKILHPIAKIPIPPITSVPDAEKGIATNALKISFMPAKATAIPLTKTEPITQASDTSRHHTTTISEIAKGTLIGAVKIANIERNITFFV